jgi:hypothetical protein
MADHRRSMKTPWILSTLVVIFMAFCLLQAWHWPVKAPPDWQPAWWQVQFLVGPGYFIAMPAIFGAAMLNKFEIESSAIQMTVAGIITLIELAISFYIVMELTVYVMKRNKEKIEPDR